MAVCVHIHTWLYVPVCAMYMNFHTTSVMYMHLTMLCSCVCIFTEKVQFLS